MANHAAIEQQHGDLEPISTDEPFVAVHIHDPDRREGIRAPQFGKVVEHVIAQSAAFPAHDD